VASFCARQRCSKLSETNEARRSRAEDIDPHSSGRQLQGRHFLLKTPSQQRWLAPTTALIPRISDGPELAALILHEITAQIQSQNDLERATLLQDQFLSVTSHELRASISTLGLVLDGLLTIPDGHGDAGRLQRRLLSMRRQVSRLGSLSDRLLDAWHIARGPLQLWREDVDLSAVVAEAVDSLRESAEQSGSPIQLRATEGTRGNWDRIRLGQIVTHLLSNAIKYGRARPIEVEVSTAEGVARLLVRDRGIGISPEDWERVVDSSMADQRFRGLAGGLHVTKKLVEAFHGSITAESQPGQGSTFTVTLPIE